MTDSVLDYYRETQAMPETLQHFTTLHVQLIWYIIIVALKCARPTFIKQLAIPWLAG